MKIKDLLNPLWLGVGFLIPSFIEYDRVVFTIGLFLIMIGLIFELIKEV